MNILGKFLSCKVQSIVSSLYVLWIAKLLFPLKNSKKLPAQLGLQTLVHSEPKQSPYPIHGASIVHRHSSLTELSPLSSSMFRSSVMGDLIGAESGDNMSSNVEELKGSGQVDISENHASSKRTRGRYRNAMTKKYPPPLLLLGQTGNFLGRMPWVFKRESRDGRLVIRAERLRRHEYLLSHRENGRLIMRLVPADETISCDECGEPITGDEEKEREFEGFEETEQVTMREEHGDEEDHVALASEAPSSSSRRWHLEDESEYERCGSLRKCFAYAGEIMGQDSSPLCNRGNGFGVDNGLLGQTGPAPIRSMTVVT